ncbi:MAG: hypothetical protein JWO76_2238 [Nocardioides sp.]|nr:hypothetical protein [Nocardioides sp.]
MVMTTTLDGTARQLGIHTREHVRRAREAYDPDGEVNLTGSAGSLSVFALTVTAGALALRSSGRGLPERFALADVLLGGVATHKFTRLVSKASVTSPLRAPFTTFDGAAGSSEHEESPRDDGRLRHTVGELLTCPFCLAPWTGAAYVAGLAVAPRVARAWAAVFAVTAVSDSLQHGYQRLRQD